MKNLKLLFLLVVGQFMLFTSMAQQDQKQLDLIYSKEEIQTLKTNQLEVYNALIYGLSNGTYVAEMPKGKELPELKSITLPQNAYSYASLGIKPLENENQYFKIANSNNLLVVKSILVLKNELANR